MARSVTVSVGGDVSDFSKSMDQAAESWKDFDAVLKAGKKTFDATRTPMEKYEAEVARLSNQLRLGAISQDTFNRAIQQAGSTMTGSPFAKGADQLDAFANAAKGALPSVGGFGAALTSLGPAGIAAGVGLAGLIGLTAAAGKAFDVVATATGEALDRIDKLDDAAANIGVSTEALSALRYAAQFAGIGSEELDGSLQKMLKNLGKAAIEGGKTAETLKRMGLDATQLANMKPDEAFVKIAQGLDSIENPAQRAAAAADIFGKSGVQMLGALSSIAQNFAESKAEAQAFGVTISDIDAAKVAAANDNLDRLAAVAEGAGNTLAIELAPAITAVTDEILNFIKANGGVVDNVKFAIEVAKQYTAILLNLAPVAKAAAVAFAGIAGGTGAAAAMQSLIPDVSDAGDRFLQFLEDAKVKSQAEAASAVETEAGLRGITEETEQAAKAQEKLAEMLEKVRTEADQIGMTDSQKKLEELAASGASGPQIEEAQKQLAALDAAKAADEAAKKAKQAEQKLKEMLDRAIKEGETAGMSETDKKLFDLKEQGASPEQIKQAEQALAAADAAKAAAKEQEKQQREAERMAQQGQKLQESLFDPAQKYNAAVSEANTLLNEGLIDAVTHQRALAKAAADYQKAMQSSAGSVGAMEKGSKEAFSFLENARNKANTPLPLGPNPNMLPPPGGPPAGPQPGGLGGKPQKNLADLAPPSGPSIGGKPQKNLADLAPPSGPSIGGKPQPSLEELAKRVQPPGVPPIVVPDANADPTGFAKSMAEKMGQKIAAARAAGVKEGPSLGLSPKESVDASPAALANKALAEANSKLAAAKSAGVKEGPGLGLSPTLPDATIDSAGLAKSAVVDAAEKIAAARSKLQAPVSMPEPQPEKQKPDLAIGGNGGVGMDLKDTPAMRNVDTSTARNTKDESDTKKIVENTGKANTELSNLNKTLAKLLEKTSAPEVVSIV